MSENICDPATEELVSNKLSPTGTDVSDRVFHATLPEVTESVEGSNSKVLDDMKRINSINQATPQPLDLFETIENSTVWMPDSPPESQSSEGSERVSVGIVKENKSIAAWIPDSPPESIEEAANTENLRLEISKVNTAVSADHDKDNKPEAPATRKSTYRYLFHLYHSDYHLNSHTIPYIEPVRSIPTPSSIFILLILNVERLA